MVFIDVAMEAVGAPLGDQRELPAAGRAGGCLRTRYATGELLQRIHGRVADNGRVANAFCDAGSRIAYACSASRDVVYVETIERDVVLISACSSYGALRVYTSLQLKERGRAVPLLNRKVVKGTDVDIIADSGIGGVDGDLSIGGRHLNYLLTCADRQGRVLRARLADG